MTLGEKLDRHGTSRLKIVEGRVRMREGSYTDPIALAKSIDDYFDQCLQTRKTRMLSELKSMVYYEKPPTVTGLALHLGLSTKSALRRILNSPNPKVRYAIEYALTYIENFCVEQVLQPDAPKGYEFLLKNMGYSSADSPQSTSVAITAPRQDGDKPLKFEIEFVRSPHSKTDDEVKRQLMIDAGDDAETASAIERQLIGSFNTGLKTIDAEVQTVE